MKDNGLIINVIINGTPKWLVRWITQVFDICGTASVQVSHSRLRQGIVECLPFSDHAEEPFSFRTGYYNNTHELILDNIDIQPEIFGDESKLHNF